MAQLTGTLLAHRKRVGEVARVLARNGLAEWAQRGTGLLDSAMLRKVRDQVVDPDVANLSEGERLRKALTELGTTWVKFGQMLSLRPDVVGNDVADRTRTAPGFSPGRPAGSRAADRRDRARQARRRTVRVVREGSLRLGIRCAGTSGDARRRHDGRGQGRARRCDGTRARRSRVHGGSRRVHRRRRIRRSPSCARRFSSTSSPR